MDDNFIRLGSVLGRENRTKLLL